MKVPIYYSHPQELFDKFIGNSITKLVKQLLSMTVCICVILCTIPGLMKKCQHFYLLTIRVADSRALTVEA